MKMCRTACLLFFVAASVAVFAADDKPKKEKLDTLTILDVAEKEQKLKTWKFTEGVRRLTWLASEKEKKEAPKGKGATPAGPEALIVRAEMDIKYLEGVLTLIPLERVASMDFDAERESVTVEVGAGEEAMKVRGSTKYKRINKYTIEAEVDKGDLGVAEVKYLGGLPRVGIRAVYFPAPKAAPPPAKGRPAMVVSSEGENKKTTHPVVDLQPLYRLPDGGEKLLPTLMFKKTLKLDVGKIKKMVQANEEGGWQVSLKAGGDETLTLLEAIPFEGKSARLLGLVGRVPVGYKLFPVSALAEITFDAEEKRDKEEPRP
jgi:hypothetical protein